MQFLLDTHTLIWFLNGDKLIPKAVREAIGNTSNQCYFSIASLWEIAIKKTLGKLEMNIGFDDLALLLADNEIEILPINLGHIQHILNLPFHHRDPFDRLIIAQSITESLVLISKDTVFSEYDVTVFW